MITKIMKRYYRVVIFGLMISIILTTITSFTSEDKKILSAEGNRIFHLKEKTMAFINDTSDKKDIVLKRIYNAPLDSVWKAWTDPEYVMRWWGPRGYTSPSCKIDFREGGRYIWCMRAPKEQGGQDMYTTGTYNKIVPMQRIEFGQSLSDKDGNLLDPAKLGMPPDFPRVIRTVLEFKSLGDKTELTVTEFDWKIGQMRDYSESGMAECLDKLSEIFTKS
jgi:uncharacterized protein YndB with AHSA1/START domain